MCEIRKLQEEGIDLVECLVGKRSMVINVNIPNRGQIPWLPSGHVVETLAQVERDRITPHIAGDLPLALHTHVRRIADVQQLTVQAARSCDREVALHALLADPLCRLDTDAAVRLLDDLIAANAAWLPEEWR